MQTKFNHLTHKELSAFVAAKDDATDLEVELMSRIDMLLDDVEDVESLVTGEVQTE